MDSFNFFVKRKYAVVSTLLVIFLFFIFSNSTFAVGMQSSTYKIQFDTLNFGGVSSSSSQYKINDSLGEVGTGDSNSSTYYMHAGYWQMDNSSISITTPSDLALSSFSGLSGGGSEGTVTWNVLTDNIAGYSISIAASTSPALKSSSDSFADYSPSGANPDYNFTNLASNSSFGFSPEGVDISSKYKDNGSSCNIGSLDTLSKCWDGLSTTPKTIGGSTVGNMPLGTDSTVRFRAESGSSHIQTSGAYSATITVTAVTL